jgi:hypothetical protein
MGGKLAEFINKIQKETKYKKPGGRVRAAGVGGYDGPI